jgi:outer membrane lipoprotein SlyB
VGSHFVFATRKIAALLEKVVVSGISGAAVGGTACNPLAGAAGAAYNQVAGAIGNDVPKFDLARRLKGRVM